MRSKSVSSQAQSPRPAPVRIRVRQVVLHLTPEQHEGLHKIKRDAGVPISESARRAIDKYLQTVAR